jgi:hypothetical protein
MDRLGFVLICGRWGREQRSRPTDHGLECHVTFADSPRGRILAMVSKRTPLRMARLVGAVAAEWGITGELRATPSHSRMDVLILVPQAVGRVGDRATKVHLMLHRR